MKAIRRHNFSYATNYRQMLDWLIENIQENYHSDGSRYYNSSSVGQFIEWRSKDKESWVLRIAGNPPKTHVEIKDEQKEILFLLRFQ